MRFVNLKYESSTLILFVGITYSRRDLLSDINNYAWPANSRYASDTVKDVSATCGISSSKQLWILCLNDLLDGDLCKKYLLFSYFLFFLGFKHDFITCVDFTRIAASNTVSDDAIN